MKSRTRVQLLRDAPTVDIGDELLPEEQRAGSDDPRAQAEEILVESEIRTLARIDPTQADIEQRSSEDTVDLTAS